MGCREEKEDKPQQMERGKNFFGNKAGPAILRLPNGLGLSRVPINQIVYARACMLCITIKYILSKKSPDFFFQVTGPQSSWQVLSETNYL